MADLVFREGTYYKKFSDVPFTGQVEGKRQGSFKNGKQEGSWVGYHENGQLFSKAYYKNGKKEGSWVYFDDDGSVWTALTGTYKDGVNISD